ncbi:MAG: MFS transporter, partial [Peptococcaceae bacterium]|jgi:predicted MFS family arabinose efflux permease|nr:MFS transporter [Peptococcaceae bacterium]
MADSIVVENSAKMNISFGTVKCFSSAGAGVIAFVMFLLSFRIEIKPYTGFAMAFFTTVLALIPAHYLPPTKGHAWGVKKAKTSRAKAGNDDQQSFRAILKNHRLMLLLSYILLLFIGIQATNVFMGIYYSSEEGMNAGLGMYGLFYAICIALETGLMLYGNRLIKSIRIHHIFMLVGFAACFRSLIIYLAPNIYVMQLSAIGHMLIFAPLWTRLAPYVNDIVPMELQATGQAAWYMMSFGLGPMAGAAIGGAVAGSLGVRKLFLVAAIMLFVVATVYSFLFRQQYKNDAASV